MSKVLVIQGAGMNMRGKVQVEVFGPLTLEEINAEVAGYAAELGLEVEFFHSNVEGEIANTLYAGHDGDVAAAVINPAGYTGLNGVLRAAIAQVRYPVIEVHASNPTARGAVSAVQPVCRGSVYGFGVHGYYLALAGVKRLLAA